MKNVLIMQAAAKASPSSAEKSLQGTKRVSTPFSFWFTSSAAAMLILFIMGFSQSTHAVTITITGNTNWSAITTGSGPGGQPSADDDIIVQSGFFGNTTLTLNTDGLCRSIHVGAAGFLGNSTLVFNTNRTLTVSGMVVMGNPYVGGSVTMAAGSTLICTGISNSSTLNTWTPGTGTVILTDGSSLPSEVVTSFYNLEITNGTVHMSVNLDVSGSLTVRAGANLNLSSFNLGSPIGIQLEHGAAASSITGYGTLSPGGNLALSYTGSGSNSATIACALNLVATRTFTVSNDGTAATDLIISGVISGTGGITKEGEGSLVLSGENTYSGNTTVNAGILQAGISGSAFGSSSAITLANTAGVLIDISGYDNSIGSLTGGGGSGGNVSLGSSILSIGANNTSPAAYAGVISGTGGIIKEGSGTLILSGSNTFTGTTTISSGTLTLGASGVLHDACALTLNGGTLSTGASVGYNETLGVLTLTANSIIALGSGSHSLSFAASNSAAWTSATRITVNGWAGSLSSTSTSTAGKVYVGVNNSSLTSAQLNQIVFFTGGNTYSGKYATVGEIVPTTDAPSGLTYSTPNSLPLNFPITPISPTVNGYVQTYSITPSLPTGLSLNTSSGVISGTPTLANGPTSYTVTATNAAANFTTFSISITTFAGVNRYSVANGNWNSTATWAATSGGSPGASVPIGGDAVFIEGGRTVTLTADAACGSITFPSGNANNNTLTINSGITLNTLGSITIPRAGNGWTNTISVGSGTLNAASVSFTNGGAVTTPIRHSITLSTGRVSISGNITQTVSTGSATIAFSGAGTLQLGGSLFTATTGRLTTAAGCIVEYNSSSSQTIENFTYVNLTLSGSGSTKTQAAALTTSGRLTINSGVILNMANTNLTTGSLTGSGSITNTTGTAGARTITIGSDNTSPSAYSGVISNGTASSVAITKNGTGTLILAGLNSYTGLTTISAGILKLGASGNTTNSPLGTIAAGTTVNTGAALDVNGFSIGTAEALTVNGTGITNGGALTNSGTEASFRGLITLGSASSIITNAGTLNIINTGTIGGAFALTIGGSGNGLIASIIGTGANTLTKNGSGTWTLSGINTYTGQTNITVGTIKLGSAGGGTALNTNTPLGSEDGATIISAGGSLDLNGYTLTYPDALTINGTGVSGSGAITNTGGNATYSGAITLASASSITATSYGALTISGNVSGNFGLTLNGAGSGTLSGVRSGTSTIIKEGSGSWTLSNANTYSGTTTLSAGTLNINNANALGTVAGPFIITGGNIDNTSGSAISTLNYPMNWNADFTFIGSNNLNMGTGTVTMNANRTLTVSAGTFTCGGVINQGTRSLQKEGAGTLSFGANNVTLNALVINTGTLVATSGTLSLNGNFTNGSTFTHNSGTLSFTGSSVQTISGSTTFNNLTINNTAGVTAAANQTVNGILSLTSANPSSTVGSLEMNTFELTMALGSTTTGQGDVTGVVVRSHAFSTATPYSFGSAYTTLNFSSITTAPAWIKVKLTKISSGPAWRVGAIQRYYDMANSLGSGAVATANVQLHYTDNELNSNIEADLSFYNSNNADYGFSSRNTTNNWVQMNAMDLNYIAVSSSFDSRYFTLDEAVTDKITWNGSASTDWTNRFNWTPNTNAPVVGSNVRIPGSTTRDPVLPASTTINSLYIFPGATLNGGTATSLQINGSSGAWINEGTFNAGTSTIIINGGTSVNYATIGGETSFNNLTIADGKYASLTINSYVGILASLSLGSTGTGILEAGSNETEIEYKGNSAQTIINPKGGLGGYHHLTLSGSGSKTFPSISLKILGDFTNNHATSLNPSRMIEFSGPAGMPQNIKGTFATNFDSLTINTSGLLVNMNTNTKAGYLLLTKGILTVSEGKQLTFNSLSRSIGTIDASANNAEIIITNSSSITLPASAFLGNINLLTLSGGSVALSDNVSVFKLLKIGTGASLNAGSYSLNLSGNFENAGTFPTGTLTLNGTSGNQTLSGSLNLNNLVINKTAGNVLLSNPLGISGQLTLSRGIIFTNSTNVLTFGGLATISGGSAISFVNGPMKKTGTANFVFPAGKGIRYAPIGISDLTASETFTAEYFDQPRFNPSIPAEYTQLTSYASGSGLSKISHIEYWDVSRAGSANAKISLHWEDAPLSGIGDCSTLKVAHWNGSAWENLGGTTAGNCIAGAGLVTTPSVVTSYSPFSFGTENNQSNPLPVELISFTAERKDKIVEVKWTTATETFNNGFIVERSQDAYTYDALGFMAGAGNSNSLINYQFNDVEPLAGISYYRLKQIDYDGSIQYSRIISINNPLPSHANTVFVPYSGSLSFHTTETEGMFLAEIIDMMGRKLFSTKFMNEGKQLHTLQTPILPKGLYFLRLLPVNGANEQNLKFYVY